MQLFFYKIKVVLYLKILKMKKLHFAFSPCPNDTFMMYALVHKKIDLCGLEFDVEFLDIEKLNQAARSGQFDVTKASAAILPFVQDQYVLLDSGAAFGIEGGPVLICNPSHHLNDQSRIVIPGEYTSANALFRRYYKKPCVKEYVLFSDIFALLSSHRADAGVIIHEDRFTYMQHGFECVFDLGLEWKNETGLPVPLGIFVAKNHLDSEIIQILDDLIKESILYARSHYSEVLPWIQEHARNEHPDVIKKHIDYYVNDLSLDMGDTGQLSLKRLNE